MQENKLPRMWLNVLLAFIAISVLISIFFRSFYNEIETFRMFVYLIWGALGLLLTIRCKLKLYSDVAIWSVLAIIFSILYFIF